MNGTVIMARGRCYAEVDLAAIHKNLDALNCKIPRDTLKMAVVKANAYGHGALPVARNVEGRVDFFGVATASEARELRLGGIKKPILVLSFVTPEDYAEMIGLNISLPVADVAEAEEISRVATGLGMTAKIHLPVDTGMGRIGVFPDGEGMALALKIAKSEGLFLEGVFSHYATADARDKSEAERQTESFLAFLRMLGGAGVTAPIAHIANSAAAAEMDSHLGMCRLGISMYGLYPSAESDRSVLRLTPAMSLHARVSQVRRMPRGAKIGYGHSFVAERDMLVGTVSAGYGDGYPRAMGGCGEVILRGVKLPIVGRVCMDQMMVDLTPIGGASVGERVTLLGRVGGAEITAEELAEKSGGYHYEILCRPTSRVPRFYI